ncbi:MAG: hypothetical protein J1E35_09300 [Lachnospiraceae bacterium]|nr:hypothetical protein [Lachnospiraceae bacterium]
MTKNVTVTDENGTYVGTTYPKRAKGLVKNGRALFVDDCTIRLSAKAEPSDNKSEVKQMNYIYFNPRGWSSEQAERSFINDFDGSLVETLMFGGWNNHYVRVFSKHISLTPNTDYCFVFWLNGGENDSSTETCQLQIVFFNNQNDCYVYKLNRNYIKPLLHTQGWELYSIPFSTPGIEPAQGVIPETFGTVTAVDTQFAFVAGAAPMAIKPAKELSFYKDWKDEPDEFANWRPQRHNIVFEDGWPSISMYGGNKYSTEVLRARKESQNQTASFSAKQGAQNLAQNSHLMAENLRNAAAAWKQTTKISIPDINIPDISIPDIHIPGINIPDIHLPDINISDEFLDRVREYSDQLQELAERYGETAERYGEIAERYGEFQSRSDMYLKIQRLGLDRQFSSLTSELTGLSGQISAAGKEFSLLCSKQFNGGGEVSFSGTEDLLEHLDARCDDAEDALDRLEECLDEFDDDVEEDEED